MEDIGGASVMNQFTTISTKKKQNKRFIVEVVESIKCFNVHASMRSV